MTKQLWLLSMFIAAFSACSSEQKHRGEEAGAAGPSSQSQTAEAPSNSSAAQASMALTDDEAASATGQMEEAIGAAADAQDDELAEQPLLGFLKSLSAQREGSSKRSCEENANSAVVIVDRSFSGKVDASSTTGTASGSVERSFHAKRTWSLASGAMHCNAAKTAVSLPFGQGPKAWDGLILDEEFQRSVAREGKAANSNDSISGSFEHSSKGSRHVKLGVKEEATGLTISKNMDFSLERTGSGKNSEGKQFSWSSSFATAEESPLKVERFLPNGALMGSTKTVNGSLSGKLKDGRVVLITFTDYKLEHGKSACKRRSGKIEGSVSKDGKTLKNFTIDLDNDSAEITLADGTKKKYEAEICKP